MFDRMPWARLPIVLAVKIYCKVDATENPIDVGDLLTISSAKGHAMTVNDPLKAFGSVIGRSNSYSGFTAIMPKS